MKGRKKDTGFPLKTCGNDSWGESASVIPDIFNRESRGFFPSRDTRMKGWKKDTGFPLTTGGNDSGVGTCGNDGGVRRGGRI